MKFRRAAVVALIVLVTLTGVAHVPPVSAWLVQTVIDRLDGPLGLDIQTSGVSAWPIGLSATLRDVRIRRVNDAEPFLLADALTVDLPLGAVRDRRRIGHITLARPRIDIDGLTRWLDSRPSSRSTNPTTPRIDSLTVTDATLSSARDDLAFTVPAMTLTLASTLTTPLGGTVTAADARLRVGDVIFDPLAIDGTLSYDGAVNIQRARLTSHITVLDVAGRIGMREGDRAMALTVAGTIAPLAMVLEPYLTNPRLDGTVRIDGRVDGTFVAPVLRATLECPDLTVNAERSGPVTTGITLSRQRLDVGGASWRGVFGGRASGRAGFVFNDARDATIDIDVAGVATAPILAIVDPTWPSFRSRATGTLRIHGPLAAGRRPQVSSQMTLAKADASPLAARGLVSVTLDPRRWTTTLREMEVGAVAIEGDMGGERPPDPTAPFATSTIAGTVTVTSPGADDALALLRALDVFDMDLAPYAFGGAVSASAALSGTVRLPVGESIVDVPVLTARDGLTGSLHATAAVGRFAVDLHDARATLGDTTGTMRGRIDARRRALEIETAVDARSADAVVRLFDLPRPLAPTGAFTATGRMTGSPDRPRVDAAVTGTGLRLFGQAAATATGAVTWDGDTLTCLPCTLARNASTVAITGEWDVTGQHLSARGTMTDWMVDPVAWPAPALGQPDTVYPLRGLASGTFDVRGAPGALTGMAHLGMRETRWDATRPGALDATVVLAHGEAEVTLAAPDLALAGRAVVEQASPFAFDASADLAGTDLSTLFARLDLDARGTAGRVEGSLTASGRLANGDSIHGTASLAAFDGTWRDLPLRLDRPSSLDWSSREIATRTLAVSLADVHLDVDGELSTRGEARGVTATLAGRAEQVGRILAALDIDAPDMQGSIDATLAIAGSPATPSVSGHLRIADGVLAWQHLPPITGVTAMVDVAAGVATLTALRAQAQDATVEARGRAPMRLFAAYLPEAVARRLPHTDISSGSLDATLTNLTHTTALAFLGERVPSVWRGGVDATASLTAQRLAADDVDGTVQVTRAMLASGDLSVAQAEPARVNIQNGRLTLEPWHLAGGGTDITASGTANLADATYPYTLALNGTLDLRLLGTVLPGRVNGVLQSQVTVRGSAHDIELLGRLDFKDANWIARDLGLAITGLNGPLVLARDRITVEGVTTRVNGGAVTVTGALVPAGSGTASEIVVKGSGIALDIPAGVVSELSGEIRATRPGPRGLPYGVSGDLFVQPGIVRSSLRQLARSAIDAASPGTTTSGLRDLMNQIGLDVRVRTLDHLVADSNELKLSVAGDVTLTGTMNAPGIQGALTATDEGELFFGGRLYKVTSGRIDFEDPNAIDPRLNVIAGTRVAGYDVTMQLLGSPTDVTTRLASDPPLSEGDLASLLATGRTLDERRGVSEEQAKAQLLSAVSGEYLGVLGRWFGLDTVRIEQDNSDLLATDLDPVARLNVSKSFGRWLDVLYSQSLRESGDTAWVITYRTGWKRLDVRAAIQTSQSETLEVRQELTFGGGGRPRPQRRRVDARPRMVDITFSGLDVDDERNARKQMKLGVGDRFDVFTWRRDQERIGEMFRSRDYQRAAVTSYRRDTGRPDQVAIDYVVAPGPITTLAVTGATLSDSAMDAMRDAWSRVGIDEFLADEWREIASEDLVARGFMQAQVTTTITTPGNPWIQRDGHVTIATGHAVTSREVDFIGNALVADDQLRRLVEADRLDPAAWVRPSLLVAPIREYYATLGHLGATVRVDSIRMTGDRAVLPVQITEGRQYLVGTLSINGRRVLKEEAITAALGLEVGAVYLPEVAQRGADRVAALYRREAFPNVLVSLNATVDTTTATADVHLTINEGPRYVLGETAIRGETLTAPSLIARAMKLSPGAPLANRAVEDAQTRLYATGIFRSVMPSVASIGEPDASGEQPVRVTFDVEEQPRYQLRYGLQATTNALAETSFTTRDVRPGATVDLRRANLFGRGFFTGVGASVTTDSSRLRFLVGSSTWFGHKADTTFSLERRDAGSRDPALDIASHSLIASGEQRWPLTQHTRVAAGYAFESLSLGLTVVDPFSGYPLQGRAKTELASVSGTVSWDTRDNVFNPLRGLFHSSRIEVGDRVFGSDLRYLKVLVQQYGFVKRRRVVFAAAVRFGAVNIGEETDIASQEVRFQAGGATTVRGYEQDALSPHLVPDLPAGGNALLILTQEVRVPIWRLLGAVAFVDAGNTFPGFRAIAFGDLAVGVGAGLRLNSPFGIIRLDLGVPVGEHTAGKGSIWYFGFGHAF